MIEDNTADTFNEINELDSIGPISTFNAAGDETEANSDFFDTIDKMPEIKDFLEMQARELDEEAPKDSPANKLSALKRLKFKLFNKPNWKQVAKTERKHRKKLELNRREAIKYLEYLQNKIDEKKIDYEALQKRIIKTQENHINVAEQNKKIFENYNKLQNNTDMLAIENKDLKLKLKDCINKFNNSKAYIKKLEAKYKILFKNNHTLKLEVKRLNEANTEQANMLKVMNSEHKDIMAKTEVFVNEYFKLKFMDEKA